MFAIFQIKNSPAIPFDKVIKVDPIFNDKENGDKWGFSVHLGDQNKRCNFYVDSELEATATRELFITQWENYYKMKYEIIE